MRRKRPLRREAGPEDLLWLRLRALKERGRNFRRNATFRTFTLAFVDHDALLVVEPDDAPRSIVRDRLLAEAGYTVLRVSRDEAGRDPDTVMDRICAVLDDRA